jgi:thymidylate kinase
MNNKTIVIVEGPDCGGKTTLAKAIAKEVSALYTHFDAPVRGSAVYFRSMFPALHGERHVVFDRSWLSESAYEGYSPKPQLRAVDKHILERVALRANVILVRCLPPFAAVLEQFRPRLHDEMLATEEALLRVYERYQALQTNLSYIDYDYTSREAPSAYQGIIQRIHGSPAQLMTTVGNARAKVGIVSERELKSFPFTGFADCSQSPELTRALHAAVPWIESKLVWSSTTEEIGDKTILHYTPDEPSKIFVERVKLQAV